MNRLKGGVSNPKAPPFPSSAVVCAGKKGGVLSVNADIRKFR
jgi:hypothetical protein